MKTHQKDGTKQYNCHPDNGFSAFVYFDYERKRNYIGSVNAYLETTAKDKTHYGIKRKAPVQKANNDIIKEFEELATKWKDETGLYSASVQTVNDTYLEIIAKGPKVLPFILKDILNGGPFHWHIALKALNGGFSPIREADFANKPKAIKNAWVQWGKENGII